MGTTVISLESGNNGPTGKLWDNNDFISDFGVDPCDGKAVILGMNGDASAQRNCYAVSVKIHRDSVWVDCKGADLGAFRVNWIAVISR